MTILTPSHGYEPGGEGPSVDRGCVGGVIEPRKDARTRVPTPSGESRKATPAGSIERESQLDPARSKSSACTRTTPRARTERTRGRSLPMGQTSREGKAKAAIPR